MRLVDVRDRFITLEVTPEDCLVQAAACEAARLPLSSYQDHRLGPLLDAFAAALEAAALAGQWTEDGDRSLAGFRRDLARYFPDGAPPATPGEAPPAADPAEHRGLALVHLAAD